VTITAGKWWRRPLAVCAVLIAVPLGTGLSGCGGESASSRAAATPTATHAAVTSPVPRAAAVKQKARAQHPRLSPRERRQARRLLKRLRKAAAKTPRNVVTDSGLIP
jgi:hypothetical protein